MPINYDAAPRVGQQIFYNGQPSGIVYKVEDTIAYTSRNGKAPESHAEKHDAEMCLNGYSLFIWGFVDGTLNTCHSWEDTNVYA